MLINMIVCVPDVQAQKMVGSGLGADTPFMLLQKMQGLWASGCVPVANNRSSLYKIDKLTVTFTHFKFLSTEYRDSRCLTETSNFPVSYRFVLGEKIQLKSGESVFAMDLEETQDPTKSWAMYRANIVYLKSGALYFGLAPLNPSHEKSRLKALDYPYAFKRR